MTVKEYAGRKGITRQAVYSAISKRDMKISQLTDDSGNLTDEGIKTLDGLFKETTTNRRKDNLQSKVSELEKLIESQQQTIASQQKTIDEQQAMIKGLADSVERLSTLADRESVNVNQAQQITAMIKIGREPFLKRLFAGKKD